MKTLLSLNLVENIGVSSLGGTNLTYNTTTDKLDLDSTITGNITFNNDITISQDLTLTGSFIGQINAYITTSQANHDQPIVCYQASGGIVPVPPANLALIIPTTNIITVNSSTGLLKSKSIQVDGNITGVTNLNTTTLPCSNLNLTNFTSDTIYNTTLNTTTINAVTIDASSSYQLDGVDIISNAGNDPYLNIRVIQNRSSTLADGMYITYNSLGGINSDLRLCAGGTTTHLFIDGDT